MMPLSPDFADFLRMLNQREVRYMDVGGWALSLRGWPRLTKDLELLVGVDSENSIRVRKALAEFGAPGELDPDFFTEDVNNVLFMGHSPVKIDVISAVDGVSFDDCYPRSRVVEHYGVEMRVNGVDDFRINKMTSGRLQDLADVDQLGGESLN
ncbi:MAG: hypothetical protein AAGA96_12760 [Verrucomicrobiota bacterium]